MSHLSEGSLRWMLDDPLSLTGEERDHLRECRRCKDVAAGVIGDARAAAILLEADRPYPADPAAVMRSLREQGLL